MRQLNPQKGLSVSPIDGGGYVLMFYELLPMPPQGLLAYAGVQDSSFKSISMMKLNSAVKRSRICTVRQPSPLKSSYSVFAD